MRRQPRPLVLAAALALASAACTGSSSPAATSAPPPATTATTTTTTTTSSTTTTSTTVAPTTAAPTTTSPPATTTTTTTSTIPPPATVILEGELPDAMRPVVTDLYRWLADDRNPAPDLPEGLLAVLADSAVGSSPWRTATTVEATLPTDERVAVVHVDRDVLFAADEGDGWEIVGAAIDGAPLWMGDEPRFLLVLGSDARPGQSQTTLRADSIHIIALAPGAGGGTILGYPRDTYVTSDVIRRANKRVGLRSLPGSTKWTNLMATRGPEIMLETARELTDLPLSGYVVTGFVGFQDLISSIGGIVVDLPRAISSGKASTPGFEPGEQLLDAARTLLLARIRKTIPGGDFARSLNQGMIILAAMAIVQNRGVDALPVLMSILHQHAWTDLGAGDLLAFGAAALLMDPATIGNLVMPGRSLLVNGASVVMLNEREAAKIIADVADDGILETVDE